MSEQKSGELELPVGYVAFHNLGKPKAWSEGDTPLYDITVAWPVSDYQAKSGPWADIKRVVHNVAVAKWGDRVRVKRDGAPPYHVPFRYGADRDSNPEQFADYVLATFRSKFPVPVVELHSDSDPTKLEPGDVRKGWRVIVAVRPKATATNVKRVTLYAYAVAAESTEPDEAFLEATAAGDPTEQAKKHFGGRRLAADTPTAKAKRDHAEEDAAAERAAHSHDRDEEAAEAEADKRGRDEPLGDGDDIPF